MNTKVWVLGDAVVDLIPQDEQTYLKCPGGAPANVAVAIARQGGDSAFIGRVGQDPLGQFMRQVLGHEGVNTQHMRLDPAHSTSTVLVDLDDKGERSFHFLVNPSADQFLSEEDLPSFNKGEWLHLCSIALANEPSRSAAFAAMQGIKAAGGWVSFDPNLRLELWSQSDEWRPVILKALALADVLKLSEEEVQQICQTEQLSEGIAWLLQELQPKALLVTLGELGTDWYRSDGSCQRIASHSVQVVDTTGAGDAFVGGLLAALSHSPDWCNNAALEQAITQANACGALATTAKGAMTALPNRVQLADTLNR